MADALLSPSVAMVMATANIVTTGVCLSVLRKKANRAKIPVMAIMAAFVFAGQMVNYAIPGTGSSGHLCGGLLLSALLGPFAGFLSMVVVLTLQALFFADGGLLAWGANCWNMAFYGCFVGYYCIWKPMVGASLKTGDPRSLQRRIWVASLLGSVVALQLGAFSVVLQTTLSGITELPFRKFVALMQPIHLAVGLVEGMITASILGFVQKARPEMLEGAMTGVREQASWRPVLSVLAALTVVVGTGVALLASDKPDGLEWALERTQESELQEMGSSMAQKAAAIQSSTAFLPDYGFASMESRAGTSVSGITGSILVAGGVLLVCFLGGLFRPRKKARV